MSEWIELLREIPNIGQLIATFVVIIMSWVIRRIIHKVMHTYIEDVQRYHKYKRVTTYLLFCISALLLIVVWSSHVMSLSTFLGLVSAGIAIALKDLLTSIAAWLFIMSRKPFVVGDRIQIGELKGDVIDIRIFQFSIMEIGNWVESDQSTGRIIHIPNHRIMTDAVANYSATFDHIWNEVKVVITFESDWRKAKKILNQIIRNRADHDVTVLNEKIKRASRKYMIYYKNLTPIIYMDVVDHGVRLTIRYLCKPKSRRTTVDRIWTDIIEKFEVENDIELAYPTQRIVMNTGQDNK